MYILLSALALLPFAPVRFSLIAQHTSHTQGSFGIQLGMLHLPIAFRVVRTDKGGHQLIFLPRRSRKKPRPASASRMQRGMTVLGTCLRSGKARRLLLQHIRLLSLKVFFRPALADASHSALLCGMLQSLTAFIPPDSRQRIRIVIQPDFFTGSTVWHGRCMVSVPLGILLITGVLVLTSYIREHKEHQPRMKEATYGSSYR